MKNLKALAAAACALALGAFIAGCAAKPAEQPAVEEEPAPAVSDTPAAPQEPAEPNVKNVLLIGSDKWHEYDPHADLMCLLKLDLDNHRITAITVPRDTKHLFSNGTYNKLNQELTYNGLEAQVKAVSETVGEPIDYYAMIGLTDYVKLVDSLGGLDVSLPYPIEYFFYTKDYPNEVYEAGPQQLDGWRAMALARARTGYGDQGLANQDMVRQYVCRLMIEKLIGLAFKDGSATAGILTAAQPLITTNIPLDEQIAWAHELGSAGSIEFVGTTGPFDGGIDDDSNLWLVTPDEQGWKNLMKAADENGDLAAAVGTFAYHEFPEGVEPVRTTTIAVG